jgi:hypothetical protein
MGVLCLWEMEDSISAEGGSYPICVCFLSGFTCLPGHSWCLPHLWQDCCQVAGHRNLPALKPTA